MRRDDSYGTQKTTQALEVPSVCGGMILSKLLILTSSLCTLRMRRDDSPKLGVWYDLEEYPPYAEG